MKTGWRINKDLYYEVDANAENFGNSTIKTIENGEEKEYSVSGGSERKRLYTNPDTTQQMSTDTLFNESDIEGYQYLIFVVTDTEGAYEVEEWCEIAPLKDHGGQFVISLPLTGALYVRKVYRTTGNVKPSTNVYELGKTIENRDACIIKSVDAVKGV